jgi:hypothetical protein
MEGTMLLSWQPSGSAWLKSLWCWRLPRWVLRK